MPSKTKTKKPSTTSSVTRQFNIEFRPKTEAEFLAYEDGQVASYVKAAKAATCVLLIGPTGTGKCVTGDTLVVTNRGLLPIESIIGKAGIHSYTGDLKIKTHTGEWETPAFTLKERSKVLRLTTDRGNSLSATPEHPLLVIDDAGNISWTEMSKIKPGYFVALGRNLASNIKSYVKIDNDLYATNTRDTSSIYYEKLPNVVNEDVATLLGLLVSEGSLANGGTYQVGFTNMSGRLLSIFTKTLRLWGDFNISTISSHSGVPTVRVFSKHLHQYLQRCGLTFEHCRNVEIPATILRSPKSVQRAFLRAYFEGDGGHSAGGLECSTASIKLATQLQCLLLEFGVVSYLSTKYINSTPYYRVYIGVESSVIFMKKIGFITERKSNYIRAGLLGPSALDVIPPGIIARLKNLRTKDQPSCRAGYYVNMYGERFKAALAPQKGSGGMGLTNFKNWFGPISKMYASLGEGHARYVNDLQKLLNGNYYFSRVVSVTPQPKKEWVYDFTLPKNRSFVANGIISHNTTLGKYIASQLTDPRNIVEYNAGAETGVDEIRKLVATSARRTLNGKRNVFIVDEVHSLSRQGMNALLTPLESEDVNGTLWILCTNEHFKLPQVLRDRALVISTPTWDERSLLRLAKRVNKATGKPIPKDISQFANPRQLLTFMQVPREETSNKKAATTAKYLLNAVLNGGFDDRKLYDFNYSTVMAISLAIREYMGIRLGWEEADDDLVNIIHKAAKKDPTKIVALSRGCAAALRDPTLPAMNILDIFVCSAVMPHNFEG